MTTTEPNQLKIYNKTIPNNSNKKPNSNKKNRKKLMMIYDFFLKKIIFKNTLYTN